MNIKKRIIPFVLAFAIVLSLVSTISVQAATSDFKIISNTEVTIKQAKKWAKSKGATETFIDLVELYFEYSSDCGDVNPAIAYVQAAKETGYGKFGGVLDESYHNPCGLKMSSGGGDTDKNAHQKFDSWDKGVQAHMDHLALYAGAKGYPKDDTDDPRHFLSIKGIATTVNALGGIGKWAPSDAYGEEVNALYKNLMDFAGVEYEKDEDDSKNDNREDNDDSKESSNASPNPGRMESKPSAPTIADVIVDNKSQIVIKNEDKEPSITSTVGWKNENGAWYYYKSDNTKAIGRIKPDSNWYYLKDDGKMATGWISDNGKWYYFDSSGIMVKGWKQLNNAWYFLTDSGAMAIGIQYDGSSLYYLKDSGVMETYDGWIKLNNKWYYSEKSGKIKTGWFRANNSSYYLQGDGSMVTGLNKINNKIYMFNSNGTLTTGWVQQNNYWYYFNQDGSIATGWISTDGSNYYLYDTGAMAKGWINLGGTWYYLKESGAMATGWVTSNGASYYLDAWTGRMLTNTKIDGFNIGSDGKKKTSADLNNTQNSKANNSIDKPTKNNYSNGKRTIAIDAGHDYGKDYGSQKTIDGITYIESDLDIQVAVKLKSELEKRGFNIVMTREEGEKPSYGSLKASLIHKVEVANDANADFFISIHHNSADGISTAQGVETYYSVQPKDDDYGGDIDCDRLEESKKMARIINDSIVNKILATNRGAKSDASAGVGTLFVLRNTNMPAVLVETGFLTNSEEVLRCADTASQQKVAEAIAEAIAKNI